MFKKYKKAIIVIVVIAGALLAYSFISTPSSSNDDLISITTQDDLQILSRDIVRNLNRIAALKLDKSVFNDPVLRNLSDFSERISPQQSGRRNPFAPFSNNPVPVPSGSDNGDSNGSSAGSGGATLNTQ